MTYFLHDTPLVQGTTVTLRGEEARHLLGARRLRRGERFALQGPDGRRFSAELREADRREAVATILGPLPVPPGPAVRVTLLQAIVKDKAAESLIEKATELGAAALCVFPTAHSTVPEQSLTTPRTRARWERIAWEACKQCDRQSPPSIALLPGLAEALRAHPAGDDATQAGWVLHPGAEHSAAEALAAHRAATVPQSLAVLIGPEGGLTDDEAAQAVAAGYTPLHLGGTLLRAETAALAACALAVLGLG